MPTIPMPSIFNSATPHYTYSGNPHVSPFVGATGQLTPEITDPDVRIVTPPDKYRVFEAPSQSEYLLVPPTAPPTADDPTGMKAMMDFLGFNNQAIGGAVNGLQQGGQGPVTPPADPVPQPSFMETGPSSIGISNGSALTPAVQRM